MARSTFEGPILQGNNRFGPLRNVGYVESVLSLFLDFTNVTPGTAGYSGATSQFVCSNGIPNTNATIYTGGAGTTFPPVAVTPTADTASLLYRGGVIFVPFGSIIRDIIVDIPAVQTLTTGTVTGMQVLVSNGFTAAAGTARYLTLGSTSTTFTAGRQNLTSQYSVTQLANLLAGTTGDVAIPPGPNTDPNGTQMSQVVVTLATTVSGADGAIPFTAGRYNVIVRYTQPDPNIGSTTAYPFGNFD
jgi:hypothetical protein